MTTATDMTRKHYQRPEVREIITKFALMHDGAWRALNGDFWYWYRSNGEDARLLNVVEDYDHITTEYRTLYQTLNVFDHSLMTVSRQREEITADNPLGTLTDTTAYTLGCDIDKGQGYDIEDPETRKAVEAAAQFLVGYLKDCGVHESVWVLFSGGGIYVEIHHEICKPANGERVAFFEERTDQYNTLIDHVSNEFFEKHPEYESKVKFDALNNAKRVFKCILSVHKKLPYAVTPLDRDAIKIDLDRARVPLSVDMIAEASEWYSKYNPAEQDSLLRLLDQFKGKTKKPVMGSKEIWKPSFKIDAKYFPPCIQYIINTEHSGTGRTRLSAILSAFLYQMGHSEEEAWELVEKISDRNGLASAWHIFESNYGRMRCPSCNTIQTDGSGYPHLGLKGLGVCKPLDECSQWPGEYAFALAIEDILIDKQAYGQEPHDPSISKSQRNAIALLQDLVEKTKDDAGLPFEDRYLEALAVLREHDRPDYERLIDKLKATGTVHIRDLGTEVKKKACEIQARTDSEITTTIPDDIKKEATTLLDEGMAFEHVTNVWQKRHHGDENLGNGLFLSVGAQSCKSSKGIHIHACGPRGMGKSDGTEKASNLIPRTHLLVGSTSPKALFYLGEQLPAGSIVYLDDTGWSDEAAQMFKTCTTFYKEGAEHTVVIDGKAEHYKTAPRIAFWITTADAQTDEQVRDRLLRIDITETPEHTQKVIRFIFDQRKDGAATFDDRETEVCREIIRQIKDVFVDVVIPYSDHIKFTGDARGATIFADLISAFAIWRHRVRSMDKNGAVIAEYKDFQDAKIFYDAISGHNDSKPTPRELKVLQAIKDAKDADATRDYVCMATGLSQGELSDVMNGRSKDGQGKHGLLHKCPALTVEVESISTKSSDTITGRRKTVYRLPEGFDILGSYSSAVSVDVDETEIDRICSLVRTEFVLSSYSPNQKQERDSSLVRSNIGNKGGNDSPLDANNSDHEKNKFSFSPPHETEITNKLPSDSESGLRTNSEVSTNLRTCDHCGKPSADLADLPGAHYCQACTDAMHKAEEDRKKTPVRMQFLKDYRTQVPRPGEPNSFEDTLYPAGEVGDIPAWKTKDLVERGIAKVIQ